MGGAFDEDLGTEEQFNIAYVCAMAALEPKRHVQHQSFDEGSVDLMLLGKIHRQVAPIHRQLQLKCTSQDLISGRFHPSSPFQKEL
jgi:hypothetical protein